jgi:hypothetical protein
VKWRGRLEGSLRVERPARSAPAFVEWIAPSSSAEPERVEGAGTFELSLPGGVVLRWKA